MNLEYRDFELQDYSACEGLVNEAWGFEKIFPNVKLASFAKLIYTKGALLYSNYRKVAILDGQVVGFIFGFNNQNPKPKGRFLFSVYIIWKILILRSSEKPGKKELINAISAHEKNRNEVISKGNSEIALFVISKNCQGIGAGTTLWEGFKTYCEGGGVKNIFVETNKLGASGFYEKRGFTHLSDFDSPLHEFATKGGQACMYKFQCK